MSKMGFKFSLVLAVLFLFTTISAFAQTATDSAEKPAVLKAVAPRVYPAIALAARAEGKVIVEVKINAAGQVTSARGIEGHKLLQAISEIAAKRWQFVGDEFSKERIAKLVFVFHIVSDDKDAEVAFHPPYEIEFAHNPPPIINTINSDPANIPKKH